MGWIYASTESPRRTHDLRWLVQTPGGKLTAKSGWAKGRRTGGTHVETYWGKDGRTGPRYPRKTRVCVQVRGGKPLCLRLSR
ncbi:hypothetical protein AB0G74_27805 [Streptomyces sp. NPDC020875]|uniref:hypothetical protein n=1 Tax=Streptomyces sp. NPDC020875 TaxID=3154898 RepID=UPI0033D45FAA